MRTERIDPEAYLVGYWLGDGCSSSRNGWIPNVRFKGGEDDRERVQEAARSLGFQGELRQYGRENWWEVYWALFRDVLQGYGFELPCTSRTKRIPIKVLEWGEQRKWELLSGMLDSDGRVKRRVRNTVSHPNWKPYVDWEVSYKTVSENLAGDMAVLLNGLRVESATYQGPVDRKKPKYGDCWATTIRRESYGLLREYLWLQKKKQERLTNVN